MRRLNRSYRSALLTAFGVAVIATAVTAIADESKPESVVTRNVPALDESILPELMEAANSISGIRVIDFDEHGNLEYNVMSAEGLATRAIQIDSHELVELSKFVPFGAQLRKLPGQGDRYIFLQDRTGAEQNDLVVFDAQTEETKTIYSGTYSVIHYNVTPDGSMVLLYDFNLETQESALWRVELEGNVTPQKLCSFSGNLLVEAFDSELEHAYVLQTTNDKAGCLYRVNLNSGDRELVFPGEDKEDFYHGNYPAWYVSQRRFIMTGNDSIAYYARTGAANDEKEFVALREANVATGEIRRVSPKTNGDVWQIGLTANERYVVYLMVEKSYPLLYVYDRTDGTTRELYSDRGHIIECSSSDRPFVLDPERDIVYFTTQSLSNMSLVRVDIATGVVTVVDKTPENGLNVVCTDFDYPSFDTSVGFMSGVHSFMYAPAEPGDTKCPVIVSLHGGPDVATTPFATTSHPLMRLLLNKGYVVIAPNYRGSWGYGVSFERSDDGYSRLSQIQDIGALVAWIKQQPSLDSDRIVLYGESWGGYIVMESLIKYPNAFAGGLSVVGVADLRALADNHYLRGWQRGEVGDIEDPEMAHFLDSISVATSAAKIKRPLFVFQGGIDPRVTVDHGVKVVDAIERAGGEVWYIEIPYAGHSMNGQPQDMIYVLQAMAEFTSRTVE